MARTSPDFSKLRALLPAWTCPACGKGNAPGVKSCVHCAKQERRIAVNPYATQKMRRAE